MGECTGHLRNYEGLCFIIPMELAVSNGEPNQGIGRPGGVSGGIGKGSAHPGHWPTILPPPAPPPPPAPQRLSHVHCVLRKRATAPWSVYPNDTVLPSNSKLHPQHIYILHLVYIYIAAGTVRMFIEPSAKC